MAFCPRASKPMTANIANTIKAKAKAANCRVDWMQDVLLVEIVTRAQGRIPASHTDPPREAKQNPMIYLARNMQFPALNLCPILRQRV